MLDRGERSVILSLSGRRATLRGVMSPPRRKDKAAPSATPWGEAASAARGRQRLVWVVGIGAAGLLLVCGLVVLAARPRSLESTTPEVADPALAVTRPGAEPAPPGWGKVAG